MSGTIGTVRPYTKTNRPTLVDEDRVITDNPSTGVGATRFADLRNQLDARFPLRTERNAPNGHAGIAADGLIDSSVMRAALAPEEVADDATKNGLTVVSGDIGRRLVRVTASGVLYLAKSTGTGAGRWIVYNTTAQATESLSGSAEIANAAEADAETDDARIMTPLKTARRINAYINPVLASRASKPGLNFDGSQPTGGLGGGAVLKNFTFPSGDLSIICNFTRSSGADMCLMGGSWGTVSLSVAAGGGLTLQAAGGIGAFSIASVCPGYGIPYSLMVIRGGGYYRLYVNGSLFGSAIADNGFVLGTPGSLGGNSSDTGGPVGWSGTISKFECINRALSAAEVATLFRTGQLSQADTYGGLMTPYSLGAFSAYTEYGADGTTFSAGSATGFTLAAVSSTGTQAGGLASGVVSKRNKRFRVSFTLTVNSGSINALYATLRVPSSGFDCIAGAKVFAISGSGVYTGEIYADNGFDRSTYLVILGGAGTFNVTISGLSIIPLGALLNLDAAQPGCGPQWRDVSGNQSDIILPGDGRSGGVTWSQPSRDPITIRVPLATGYAWGIGNPCIPAGYVLKEAFAGTTATGTLSLGGSSSDLTRLINAQALVASRPITLAADRVTSTSSLYLSGSGLGGNLYLTFGPA